mmetsp:Transcript_4890/g.19573  ORF Transcript_4890/g.19573 Transcript_4890/m.19573 type:complete len:371 (-) Transcript_4890:231-1343(-)
MPGIMSIPLAKWLPSFDVETVTKAIVEKPFPFLDHFTGVALSPRTRERNTSTVDNTFDGTINVEGEGSDAIKLGYRFYKTEGGGSRPVFVHFGRNTDLAADCDDFAPTLRSIVNAHLLAIDYRGYGWSTGKPLLSALTGDMDAVVRSLPSVLVEQDCAGAPLYLYGAAIGSQCTIYMANKYPGMFKGMVIEAGMSHLLHLPEVKTFASLFPGGQAISESMPDIYHNEDKLRECTVPLLVLHGDCDDTVPIAQGEAILEASGACVKRLHKLVDGNHEDLHSTHGAEIMTQIRRFVEDTMNRSRTMLPGESSDEIVGRKRDRDTGVSAAEDESVASSDVTSTEQEVGLSLEDSDEAGARAGPPLQKKAKSSA